MTSTTTQHIGQTTTALPIGTNQDYSDKVFAVCNNTNKRIKKTRNGKCHRKFEGYMQIQGHQINEQNNDCSNTGISNYPVWSTNLDYQKGREEENVCFRCRL